MAPATTAPPTSSAPAIRWEIDGEPVEDDDLLSCLLLLFMAGLDTVAAQLSYGMHHLAATPADRERLVADPSLVPVAVEEMLRTFPIVQTARKVTTDIEFHGCPLRAGDMVVFPLGSANRDEQTFPDGTEFALDRGFTRHIAFGAGPHRCLGSHLARQEMAIAIEEWHRRIPDYRLDPDREAREHGGGVYGLDGLPLVWDTAGHRAPVTDYLNFLLLGLGNGAVFAALAVALVVTYRSSGVLELRHRCVVPARRLHLRLPASG